MRGDLWGWFAGRLCNKLVAPGFPISGDLALHPVWITGRCAGEFSAVEDA